ncbi:DUF6867 family protein [Azospirillum halopraeferens]|uniref:DUF6867 family protein n=1 Tax=Azospirillum halopraeferens TaxID=34010 RepID=UPI0004236441|nr:hypothetical protein [Azospirillum halopraeferens]
MDGVLGASPGVFIFMTVILFGGCAILTGQALAEGWKPIREVYGYSILLGLGDRFLVFALFGGELLSIYGFVLHTAVIGAIAVITYRAAKARRMVSQYPWLYERAGPFGWRERPGTGVAE